MKHSMLSCMRSRFLPDGHPWPWASTPGVAFDLTQNHIYYRDPNNL